MFTSNHRLGLGVLAWALCLLEANPGRANEDLYRKVASGVEAQRVLDANSQPDYREQLDHELKAVAESEMWRAGAVVRSLRPERTD